MALLGYRHAACDFFPKSVSLSNEPLTGGRSDVNHAGPRHAAEPLQDTSFGMDSRDSAAAALAWAANRRRDQTKALIWAVVRHLTRSTTGPAMSQVGHSGLHDLLDRLARHGLGDIASSWVSTGPNLPITSIQLANALGDLSVDGFARAASLPREVVIDRLVGILPLVVDRLTPDGVIPDRGLAEHALDLLDTLAS